jgi:pilus assembly protein Flp/PilA
MLRKFWDDESGPTAIEYGLIAALIAVAIIAALEALSGSLTSIFNGVATELDTAAGNFTG